MNNLIYTSWELWANEAQKVGGGMANPPPGKRWGEKYVIANRQEQKE